MKAFKHFRVTGALMFLFFLSGTNGHEWVPKSIAEAAEKYAKVCVYVA